MSSRGIAHPSSKEFDGLLVNESLPGRAWSSVIAFRSGGLVVVDLVGPGQDVRASSMLVLADAAALRDHLDYLIGIQVTEDDI